MGSAALWAHSRLGRRGVALDRFRPPHAFGEHAGEQRMFRMSYYEHPDYVPMLRRALSLWRELPAPSPHLHLTGAVYMGPPDGEVVSGAARAADRHALPHDLLSGSRRGERYPWFRVPDSFAALAERDAGFVVPELAVARMLEASRARVHEETRIESWHAEPGRVRVRAGAAEFHARALILAAGPWSGELLAGLGVTLTVTRQVQVWLRPRDPELFALGRFPCWAIELPEGLLYGFPIMPGSSAMKVALHRAGRVVHPDRVDRVVSRGDTDEVVDLVASHLPGALGPVDRAGVCLYTNSADGHFILDRHPRHPNVILACGFSGHGFKFAPVIGEIATTLALDPEAPHPAPFLSLARWGSGAKGKA